MFRLSDPISSQKTPLFPKPRSPESTEREKDKKKVTDDEKTYIPVIFRSFKQEDMYSVPTTFSSQILEDITSSKFPKISQVYPQITSPLDGFVNRWNSQFYGDSNNLILNVPSQTEVTPFLCLKENQGSGQFWGTKNIQFAIQFNKLAKNHHYLGHIGASQPWEDIDIELTNDSGNLVQKEKIIRIEVPIQYVQFNEYMDYMYIYIYGIRKDLRLLKTGDISVETHL